MKTNLRFCNALYNVRVPIYLKDLFGVSCNVKFMVISRFFVIVELYLVFFTVFNLNLKPRELVSTANMSIVI